MSPTALRARLHDDIERVPEERLEALATWVRRHWVQQESDAQQHHPLMRFAGTWRDMPDDEFEGFLGEIDARRAATGDRGNRR